MKERIIEAAERTGASCINVSFNRGGLPHELFLEQIRRFARDVLPALQAHEVRRVPLGEEALACSGPENFGVRRGDRCRRD